MIVELLVAFAVVFFTHCVRTLYLRRQAAPQAPKQQTVVPADAAAPQATGCGAPGGCGCAGATGPALPPLPTSNISIPVVYATQKGQSRTFAFKLASAINAQIGSIGNVEAKAVDAKTMDPETIASHSIMVFIAATYEGGTPPPPAESFASLLQDAVNDFRVQRDYLSELNYAVFGLGQSDYGKERFCKFALDLDKWLGQLGGKAMLPPVLGDEPTLSLQFNNFIKDCLAAVPAAIPGGPGGLSSACGTCAETDEGSTPYESEDEGAAASTCGGGTDAGTTGLDDVEDFVAEDPTTKEMLYPRMRKSLEKQGYHLVGSHSAVKLCRWTKSMLRGRGGCYKHTFYNISSFQCMEMTPSLACANKCVFCWRHHTNPVTKEWRWRFDKPEFIVDTAIAGHRKMINVMRGVPGVIPERLAEAQQVRHCALSLVGEPIIYPEVNKFCNYLHEKRISTFMVTNAQFPEAMEQLEPVTQLYISIDAATRETLKAVDRPIHEDFWERFIQCVAMLKEKRQRTVFRLTLVKEFNVKEIRDYAKLVRLGRPDFIEVKGVTFCGKNDASPIRMKNVPYHIEVVKFCEALVAEVCDDYDIACEHEHSCCMLLAKNQFRIDGKWHTWIDYDKFFALAASGRKDFTALEYAQETPTWATFQSKEHGFDPKEVRHYRKSGAPISGGC